MEKTAIRRMIMTVCAVALTGVTMMGQLLWKVEGNGAKGASYLFGTHHIAPVTLTDSIADFGEAIKSVDAVYGEVEQMESMQDPATMQKMAALMMAPADSTMSKLLSPAQLDSVCAMMTEYTGAQIAPQMLDALKPAALSMQIAMMQNMKMDDIRLNPLNIPNQSSRLWCRITRFLSNILPQCPGKQIL